MSVLFGYTTDPGSSDNQVFNRIRLGRYPLSSAAVVSEMRILCASNGANPQWWRACIYSDKTGPAPDALLGYSDEVIIEATDTTLDWRAFSFSTPVSLTSGYYWIGWGVGSPNNSAAYYRYTYSPGNTGGNISFTYPDFPANLGTITAQNANFGVYAVGFTPPTISAAQSGSNIVVSWT